MTDEIRSQTEQSDSGVKIAVTHSTHIAIDLTSTGGTLDGIDVCVNNGDSYEISPDGARQLARAFDDAADRRS